MQIHSAEAAAQPWGTNPCQEVSLSDSPLHSFDHCIACSAISLYSEHSCTSAYMQSPSCMNKLTLPSAAAVFLLITFSQRFSSSLYALICIYVLRFQLSEIHFHSFGNLSSAHREPTSLHLHYSRWAFRQAMVNGSDNLPQSRRGKRWVSNQKGRDALVAV